ncbi:hypothetical protein [Acetobacter sp. UBA5411]|uniref:hypothetical protein n=1 Tax=Acetobacter sp. UBA5411 TaxID=1945905 RepID=UPI0025C13911|nr:hypothetical protein [Acetobacter sp. UBA5411]
MSPLHLMLEWSVPAGIFVSGMFALFNVASDDSTAKFAKLQFAAVVMVVCIYAAFK